MLREKINKCYIGIIKWTNILRQRKFKKMTPNLRQMNYYDIYDFFFIPHIGIIKET